MPTQLNLRNAMDMIAQGAADEVVKNYRNTRFRSSSNIENPQVFVDEGDLAFGFSLPFYAEFLDRGTKFIQADPFITPVLDDVDESIEGAITVAFEQDITDTLDNAFGTNNITRI